MLVGLCQSQQASSCVRTIKHTRHRATMLVAKVSNMSYKNDSVSLEEAGAQNKHVIGNVVLCPLTRRPACQECGTQCSQKTACLQSIFVVVSHARSEVLFQVNLIQNCSVAVFFFCYLAHAHRVSTCALLRAVKQLAVLTYSSLCACADLPCQPCAGQCC